MWLSLDISFRVCTPHRFILEESPILYHESLPAIGSLVKKGTMSDYARGGVFVRGFVHPSGGPKRSIDHRGVLLTRDRWTSWWALGPVIFLSFFSPVSDSPTKKGKETGGKVFHRARARAFFASIHAWIQYRYAY